MKGLAKLLTSKSFGDDLYPPVDIIEDSGSRHLTRRNMPFFNMMFFTDMPYWQTLTGLKSMFDWFHINPIFYAVVMIKAREYSNMRIKVVSRDGKEEPESTRKALPRKLYDLFNSPNVLQSRSEFLMQRKVFEEVCGNSFTYGNFAIGMTPNINTLTSLWNVWPAYMQFKLRGKYFEATNRDEIIEEWKFEYGNYKKTWKPNEIMHKNKPNTRIEDGLIFGRSPASSLYKPLSNIDMAYEARNVLMRNKGMRAIISSNKSDDSGIVPLTPDEEKQVQEKMGEYGLLNGQKQFWFSPLPLNVTAIDQDVQKLGLFEEIATDAMTVCNAYGVPEVLLKLYIKGATFENQEASVRRLYQGTIIPEAEDDMIAFNTFLGLNDTEWKLVPDFSHVAALQEDKKREAEKISSEKKMAMEEVKNKLITTQEYRDKFGYGPMPEEIKDSEDEQQGDNADESQQ